jgi:threonine aldolase
VSVVDLRSDTVTRPSAAMRAAMAAAEVGDDVYGEDPEVNALEAEVAGLLGFEAGLFCPSGSLTNQLGLRLLARPGQEVLCDSLAHIARGELGAAAVFSGITFRTWAAQRGRLDVDVLADLATPAAGPYLVSTAAIAVENTHNFGGGTVQPGDQLKAVVALAQEHGLGLHLDGARLWNAHVATGTPLRELTAGFDTVSVCLSKGLGAPAGSLLLGPRDFIAQARRWRKALGGGMRQAGVLAAAGLYALQHHVPQLAEDHANAEFLADELRAIGLQVEPTQTNMVYLRIPAPTVPDLKVHLQQRGILATIAPRTRLVTHLDLPRRKIAAAVQAFRDFPHWHS